MPGAVLESVERTRGGAIATAGLARLAAEIEAACGGQPVRMSERVVAALQAAAADPDLLATAQCQPCPDRYSRHILHADPAGRFTILALVWGPGQFSPVHAHHAWCAYAVRDRDLMETLFEFEPATAQAVPLRTQTRRAGYGCFAHSGLDQIHRLGNAGSDPAISIHVYGVEGARVCSHVNRVLEPRQ